MKRIKYTDSPWTVPERFMDRVLNPTEPNSPECVERVNEIAQQVRDSLTRMSPDQLEKWRAEYYRGFMISPFGLYNVFGADGNLDEDKAEASQMPFGYSYTCHMPRLCAEDTDEVIDALLADDMRRGEQELIAE